MSTISNELYNRTRAQEALAVFDTQFAVAFGLEEGIFLSRLIYFTRPESKVGVEIDGERWYYSTYANWLEYSFPWMAERTLRRMVNRMENDKLIISFQQQSLNRQKYYRPNFEVIWDLLTKKIEHYPEHSVKEDRPTGQVSQVDDIQTGRMLINSKSLTVSTSSKEDKSPLPKEADGDEVKPEPTKLKVVYMTVAKKRKPRKRAKSETPRARNPMFDAVAEVCKMDPAMLGSRIAKASHTLEKAGYTPQQVMAFTSYWQKHSYYFSRYKRPPTPEQLIAEIKVSLEIDNMIYDIPEEDQLSYDEQQRRFNNANTKRIQSLHGPEELGEEG
ncbi:MAG TPA: hypothetical protein PLU37_02295 [Chitinophagaceae bacterium]|nr:hypothetical protein [Chitinophagaceae bacterium]